MVLACGREYNGNDGAMDVGAGLSDPWYRFVITNLGVS